MDNMEKTIQLSENLGMSEAVQTTAQKTNLIIADSTSLLNDIIQFFANLGGGLF